MRYKSTNDIQTALQWLDGSDGSKHREVSFRATGDGKYAIRCYENSMVIRETTVRSSRQWDGLIKSLGDVDA